MAKFDNERAHMAANLVSDPPVPLVAEVYRKLGWDRDSLSRHEPNGHNIAVMTRWNGDTPKSICHVFRHRGTF